MFGFLDPTFSHCIDHGDQITWLLEEHGEPAFALASVMELWGLKCDDPKVDSDGFFRKANTLLHFENDHCLVKVLAAEAQFQCWSMSYACSFDPGKFSVTAPSIWNDCYYTSAPNALYWGQQAIASILYRTVDDLLVSEAERATALMLIERHKCNDRSEQRKAQREANLKMIAEDPAYANFVPSPWNDPNVRYD